MLRRWVNRVIQAMAQERRTTHRVEVQDVRPPEDDPGAFDPYFVAICDECDWLSDIVSLSPGHIDPEGEVRRQAAGHTDRVDPKVNRPLG